MQRDVTSAQPLAPEEFAALMQRFGPWPEATQFAIAVSGGPDSMALAFLLKNWCAENSLSSPLALIVDHRLRDESFTEAQQVRDRLAALSLPAEILIWEHEPVTSRLHAQARKARYELLTDACHRHGLHYLLAAHQRDDQAETILMRFCKGSGIDGLAGMAAQSMIDDVALLRPLLDVPKERLIATCTANAIPFVTDPSNEQEKFARGRLRRVMPLLAAEGLSTDSLIDLGTRAQEAQQALDHVTQHFATTHTHMDACGVIYIHRTALLEQPRAIALRCLSAALQAIQPHDYPPQHASVTSLLDALTGESSMPSRTLHGCFISADDRELTIMREFAVIDDVQTLHAGQSIVWDKRWRLTMTTAMNDENYTVQTLGNPPHDVIDRIAPELRRCVPQGRVRAALPALWRGHELTGIPHGPDASVTAELLTMWPLKNRLDP
jgi:tRNA(Ile)-lysidine synthase